ncbi:hypothetical protein SDC9_173586 [bioreactor metagenome]|uniref:Uncharacterized protein n=1 Tax=bioreactor metagenome TaxID=1076179 RepID=A0A645GJV9_9ZZZZ
MKRFFKKCYIFSLFNNLPQVHNSHFIRNVTNNTQIVRYKQIGVLTFFLQIAKQIENLSLNADIKRRNGFVKHYKIRIKSKGPGYSNALTTTTVKLMRKRSSKPLGKSYRIH